MRRSIGTSLAALLAAVVLVAGACGGEPSASQAPVNSPAATSEAPSEAEYQRFLDETTTAAADVLGRLGDLTRTPRLGDSTWEFDLSEVATLMGILHEKMRRRVAPSRVASVHSLLTEAFGKTADGMRTVALGAAALDEDLLAQGDALIGDGNRLLAQAFDLRESERLRERVLGVP